MRTLGVIPARYASTRFMGKPLANIGGKSMIQRVYEQTIKAKLLSNVVVATDDERIFKHVESFGGVVIMTQNTHQSGTDRCAEVAKCIQDIDAVVNIQGDEPFIDPSQIDLVIETLMRTPDANIATLIKKIDTLATLWNPNAAKVVVNQAGEAIYFSRSPIPFLRGVPQENWLEKAVFYKHLGLYAFRKDTLLAISTLPLGQLEQAESLEQLRWLEFGYKIAIGITDIETFGIDMPEDLLRIRN